MGPRTASQTPCVLPTQGSREPGEILPRKLKQVLRREFWSPFQNLLIQGTEVRRPFCFAPVRVSWSPRWLRLHRRGHWDAAPTHIPQLLGEELGPGGARRVPILPLQSCPEHTGAWDAGSVSRRAVGGRACSLR